MDAFGPHPSMLEGLARIGDAAKIGENQCGEASCRFLARAVHLSAVVARTWGFSHFFLHYFGTIEQTP